MNEKTNRYICGNGEGMFYDSDGDWVAYEDYKELLDKYKRLASTIKGVSDGDFNVACPICGKKVVVKIGDDGIPEQAPVCSDECYEIFKQKYKQ